MTDTFHFPDTKCCIFIDPQALLWLIWPMIVDGHWVSALLKYHVSDFYQRAGPPVWKIRDVLHETPSLRLGKPTPLI